VFAQQSLQPKLSRRRYASVSHAHFSIPESATSKSWLGKLQHVVHDG